jgi:hypothetical protein
MERLLDELAAFLFIVDVQAAEITDVLDNGQFLEYRNVLRDDADVPLQFVRIGLHRAAEYLNVALAVFQERQNAVDGRRLAGTVRTKQPEHLPFRNLQIKMIERDKVAVSFHEVFNLDYHLICPLAFMILL